MRPSLSNDFSYYRRLLPKFQNHDDIKVREDEANGMTMFTAQHIPMMNALCKAADQAFKSNEAVPMALAVMAMSCLALLKAKKFEEESLQLLCARAMTGAIVLYDHVDALGAFAKKSLINVKACVVLLKAQFPKEQSLLNAIQFSTKTFKSSPDSLQELFN